MASTTANDLEKARPIGRNRAPDGDSSGAVPAKSIGHTAGRRAFERTFGAIPDLRAEVLRWSATGDTVFIEMVYTATLGKRTTRWHAVDRFLFAGGEAIVPILRLSRR